MKHIESYFSLKENSSNIKTEIIAGATIFISSMYIIVINPAILSAAGMDYNALVTATILVSAFSSIAMGLFANNPILIAPGMGINSFFAYSVVIGLGVKWETALGAVFWSGVIFLILSVFNIRTYIVKAIPKELRFAITAGIGLFIAFLGFANSNFIIANNATIIGLGKITPSVIIFLIGLVIASLLVIRKVKGALIISIAAITLIASFSGRLFEGPLEVCWNGMFAYPDFSLLFRTDFIGSLKLSFLPVIFAFLFTDLFDSLSTFIGVAEAANLYDNKGEPRNVKASLTVDAFSTAISGLFGTSSGTSYIESATGIKEGGRTGLTAITAGLLFLPFLFLAPLISVVPAIATAPTLVIVGVFMMKPISKIDWNDYETSIPAFIAMFLIPLAHSITEGIIWSFLIWTIIKICFGKLREVSIALIIIDIFAIISLLV